MEITYIDRKTGKTCIEKVYGQKALHLLYGDTIWEKSFSWIFLPIASLPVMSWIYAFFQKRKESQKKIEPFIRTYVVDASEFASTNFQSFNDFFIRKLKPEARPIVKDPKILAMPADGRYLVYPRFENFRAKGKDFSLKEFLQNLSWEKRFSEGSMAMVRLCPSDYHRFHFPCDGIPSGAKLINGFLYSVNPIALRKRISILAENKRMVTEIQTDCFGTILYVEIGATNVGSIHQTYTPEKPVKKGEEKGYFEFGGSCIILLFEPNAIQFDTDLIANTEKGLETKANFGESLGRVK